MMPAPRRRTRATGFSPGGPRELKDAPRRHTRGGPQTTAAGKAAPTAPSRTADPMDLDKVEDSESGADVPASPRRGRGETRPLRARTRSSSPLVTTGLPDNQRTRSPLRDADAARQPRRGRLGRGLGKHARVEDTLAQVVGPAEESGGESSRSSVARPAKRLRAGDRGGEAIRRQVEREKRLMSPPPTAPVVTTPSGVRASVLRVGASALKYLGFRTESPHPVAEGDGDSSPSPEVSSREAPVSTTERPSGQEVVKSTGGPVQPDGGALASAVLHERSGEDLMQEQRRATDLRKLLKLGRRNVVPLKAPSECGSDDEEAAKAAYRFTEELRPVSLPSYDASTRYVGWTEGNSGMLVVEEEESDDSKDDRKGKRTDHCYYLSNSSSSAGPSIPFSPSAAPGVDVSPLAAPAVHVSPSAAPAVHVSHLAAPAVHVSHLAAPAVPVSHSAGPVIPVSPSATPVVSGPVVKPGRKLVRILFPDANILIAVKTALGWFNEHSDTVPTPDELVGVLGKYRFDQLASTTGRTYRAPSPSDPYEDFEFESDTGEPIDRLDGEPLPPPRNPRRRKITARSVPDFNGPADGHLPVSLQGLPFDSLPKEWQLHKKSWKIKQRDLIHEAQLADRRDRGIDEDDYQMGLRAHAKQENQRRLRESQLVAAGKAVNDRIRLGQLKLEKRALRAIADKKRAEAFKAASEPAGWLSQERAGRSSVRRSPVARAPRYASPRCPTISEEADEEAFAAAPGPAPKMGADKPERPSPAAPAPAPAPKTADDPAPAPMVTNEPASAPPARRGGKKPRANPPEWAGLPINPRTHLPEGTVGLFYDVNYFSESDDYSDEGESPAPTAAANAVVSDVGVDVGALVDSIPSHELKALFASPDVGVTDFDITSIVDAIPRDEFEALIGIPLPLASDSHDNFAPANFAISDDVMAMVDAIPDRDLDEMMGGILAGCSSAGSDMGQVGVSS
ncbi:hypothetical protein VC83_04285 [Pseudogymnoascus destructans]|uniref:Uncharacterized protein n=1 Tax=Pseudogymnoascus destructans TaxID=655981 RepID=A0A177ABU5_9PEZI|nr:uncharacterized protein VC83_04285 [Pseudogymnoascus destructans]OAF59260.2 hypothetical protein VC83_04285 [Pseudogymnoascus destructans]